MQVMCLNGWGGKLYGQLMDYLQTTSPDVLCLQEVVHTPDAPLDWLEYRDEDTVLPQRARFFEEVCAVLPDHTACFCPAAQGDLWHGDDRYTTQWGLATFVHRSLPIIAQHQGFVHGEFGAHGFGESPRSRNAHAVRVFDYENDFAVSIAHLHGLRVPSGKEDNEARHQQARRLASLTSAVAEDGDRIVVCGDFNVLPDSRTFDILAELGLTDLVTSRGFDSTRTSHYTKPGKFADYMLVNSRLKDAAFDIIQTPEVSDHCPLVLTIEGVNFNR